jgi:archaea-specific DNA-binding protein
MSSKPSNPAVGASHSEDVMEERAPMAQNHIYVGKKPVMSYAMSALIQLSQAGEVVIKARGLAIGRAVDVAEIVTKRLGNGAFAVKNISISTEQVKSVDTGEMRNVSSIEILVGK